MSGGVYSDQKVYAYPERLQALRTGKDIYPVHLHLILSDLCNLDCPGCAYRMSDYSSAQRFIVRSEDGSIITHNPNRFLDTALVRRVLEECVEMGTTGIEFTGGGEPTVHKDARELIGYAQELGLDTALITNGILLGKIGEAAVRTQWLRISVDAATALTFGKVRPTLGGSNNVFERVLEEIGAAVDFRNRLATDCRIGVGFVVQKENWEEIYQAVELYRSLGVDNVRISGLFTSAGDSYFEGWKEDAVALERRAVEELSGPSFRVYGRLHEKVADLAAPPDYEMCGYQHFTQYLAGDGNLYRCCVTSYNDHGYLGNVAKKGSIKGVLDDVATRERLNCFDARSCGRCQFNDRNRVIASALEAPPVPAKDTEHASFL